MVLANAEDARRSVASYAVASELFCPNGKDSMSEIQAIARADVEAKVLQARGPVAVDFYQATCPPCQVLEKSCSRRPIFEGRIAFPAGRGERGERQPFRQRRARVESLRYLTRRPLTSSE